MLTVTPFVAITLVAITLVAIALIAIHCTVLCQILGHGSSATAALTSEVERIARDLSPLWLGRDLNRPGNVGDPNIPGAVQGA